MNVNVLPQPTPLVLMVRDRLYHRNQNWMVTIDGKTGDGKSYLGLNLCASIDPSFRPKTRVVFNPDQFMALINSGTLRKGNAIMFDEAGVGMPARDWNTVSNKMFERFLQIFRTENLAVIFTVPTKKFFDTNARALTHSVITAEGVDLSHYRTKCKVYEKYFNPIDSEYYPRTMYWHGRSITMQYFHKPPLWMSREYDALRDSYSESRKTKTAQGIQQKVVEPKPVKKSQLIIQLLTERPETSVSELVRKFNITQSYAGSMKQRLRLQQQQAPISN